ncbi:hypothetical protein QFW80_15170 [Luteimonas sp. M1R5S18]|uniref:Lipoprotein n=1 Tax=Luteimonas rhizosphaericola TaxID=3042024 RepID=A0ABT6JPI4_9GAMM|nr:hypothetical protein [Luteimonas rhizosphaericola]MDH5831861.1 hypothetical protein [Luteimonas rhizosphaericola]
MAGVRDSSRPALMKMATLALAAALLASCRGDEATQAPGDAADADAAPLPQPRATDGAITGMPERPGPGDVPLAGAAPPPPPDLLPVDAAPGTVPLEDNPETGLATPAPVEAAVEPTAEPTPADAEATLRAYYAAIQARDYARAYAAWSDGGRASGQDPDGFAAGFRDTTALEVTYGAPEPVEAAAGSRYVEVPVTVTTTRGDGSVQRLAGRYVLRRAVVDGASAEQRAWHIASADLREAASP